MKNRIDPAKAFPPPTFPRMKRLIPFGEFEKPKPTWKDVYPAGYPNGPWITSFVCMPEVHYCSLFERTGHFHDCAVGRGQRAMHDPGDEHRDPPMFYTRVGSTDCSKAPQENEG